MRVTEKKNHKKFGDITTPFRIRIDDNNGFTLSEPLDQFHFALLCGYISEFYVGNLISTPSIIYRAITSKIIAPSLVKSEQMQHHIKTSSLSYKTIYQAVYAGMFDTPDQRRSQGNRGAHRKLRHRGKPCRPKGYVSNRSKIPISHELKGQPVETNERSRLGDWEADTIVGKNRKSGFLTLVDRHSRFLIAMRLTRLGSKEVLESVLGAPAIFGENLEALYREVLIKVEEENQMEADAEIAKNLPYSDMVKYDWIPSYKNPYEKVSNLRKFFEVSTLTRSLLLSCRLF